MAVHSQGGSQVILLRSAIYLQSAGMQAGFELIKWTGDSLESVRDALLHR